MIKQRTNPETHPTRLIGVMDGVSASVYQLQRKIEEAPPEDLRQILAETLGALQTTADCVAALTRRVARAPGGPPAATRF